MEIDGNIFGVAEWAINPHNATTIPSGSFRLLIHSNIYIRVCHKLSLFDLRKVMRNSDSGCTCTSGKPNHAPWAQLHLHARAIYSSTRAMHSSTPLKLKFGFVVELCQMLGKPAPHPGQPQCIPACVRGRRTKTREQDRP